MVPRLVASALLVQLWNVNCSWNWLDADAPVGEFHIGMFASMYFEPVDVD